MQQRENRKEAMQSISHMLLHHFPPDAQTDESHEAEGLDADGGACLHPTGEPEYSRMGKDHTPTEAHFLTTLHFKPEVNIRLQNI